MPPGDQISGETDDRMREQVRARYAEAARAVLTPERGETAGCCGGSAGESCCGTGSAALYSADCFGGPLYGEGETDGLPEQAVQASLGCGNPLAVRSCGRASGCWTWARAAASTCCCRRGGSAPRGSPTGWT